MKKWLEYQLKNQVVDRDWDKYTRPVVNLNSVLAKTFAQIKANYYADQYHTKFTPYFTDQFYMTAGGNEVSAETLSEWINDPAYAELMNRNGIDSFKLKDDEDRLLKILFAEKLNLDPATLVLLVHLQQPGQFLAMHIDRVWNVDIHSKKDKLSAEPKRIRYLVFFDDWQWGQVCQMGTEFLKWQAGDVFTWKGRDVPHGTANLGYEPRFVLVLHGVIKDPPISGCM